MSPTKEMNPLLLSSTVKKCERLNNVGRPVTANIKLFGPQPRSMIAQMLSDIKSRKNNDSASFHEASSQDAMSHDLVEADKLEQLNPEVIRDCSEAHKALQSPQQHFFCDYANCSYSCKLSSNLIKHKRVHTNEKPYLCDRCSFRTNFVNSLKAHKRIHTAEKPYKCSHCSYKCNSSSNLKKHCHLRHPEGNKCKYK
uniref:C2H2-type domain-containing protein n=1 Tax=Heliothis virescens TaxID=7102 RepID=A0A2A4K1V1_HELVI